MHKIENMSLQPSSIFFPFLTIKLSARNWKQRKVIRKFILWITPICGLRWVLQWEGSKVFWSYIQGTFFDLWSGCNGSRTTTSSVQATPSSIPCGEDDMFKGRVRARKATDIYFPFTTLNSDTTYQLLSDLPRRFVEVHHLIKIPRRNLKLKCAF